MSEENYTKIFYELPEWFCGKCGTRYSGLFDKCLTCYRPTRKSKKKQFKWHIDKSHYEW
jgi:hypothetical protein